MMPSWMTPAQRGKGLYADYLFNAIAGNWERKRPVWVMLMVNSLTETDVRSRGVPVLDLYLAQQAEKMRKTTGAVERVEEQCHPLNGLNFSQVSPGPPGPRAQPFLCAFLLFSDCLPAASRSCSSLKRRGSFEMWGSSWAALWWSEDKLVCAERGGESSGVCFCLNVPPGRDVYTPHLLCPPKQKEFPSEHHSDKKQRGASLCLTFPEASRAGGCPEATGRMHLGSRLCVCVCVCVCVYTCTEDA